MKARTLWRLAKGWFKRDYIERYLNIYSLIKASLWNTGSYSFHDVIQWAGSLRSSLAGKFAHLSNICITCSRWDISALKRWVLQNTTLSGFLPPSKNMHVGLIGVSKIVLRSECERVCGCLSRLSLCGPVMDWRPVQDVPVSRPMR